MVLSDAVDVDVKDSRFGQITDLGTALRERGGDERRGEEPVALVQATGRLEDVAPDQEAGEVETRPGAGPLFVDVVEPAGPEFAGDPRGDVSVADPRCLQTRPGPEALQCLLEAVGLALAVVLRDQQPGSLRLRGGCVIEGEQAGAGQHSK